MLVSRNTTEVTIVKNFKTFVEEHGHSYKIVTRLEGMEEQEVYNSEQDLLQIALSAPQ